jgi:hypothetical protein
MRKRRIQLWDIRIQKQYLAVMRMTVKGLQAHKAGCEENGMQSKAAEKDRTPFVLNKYRRRKAFFAGAFVSGIDQFPYAFVWSIEISGTHELEPL